MSVEPSEAPVHLDLDLDLDHDLEPSEDEALGEEREFLLRSLRDLDAEHAAGDLDDDDYNELREEYVARAAAALRRQDDEPAGDDASVESEGEAPALVQPLVAAAAPRRWRTVLITLGVIVFAIVAGVLVARMAGRRLPGDSATGGVQRTTAVKLAEASKLLQVDPVSAVKLYSEILRDEPDNAEALTYEGWLLVQTNQADLVDRGAEQLDRAIAVAPDYADPHVFKGLMLRAAGNTAGAIAEFDTYLRLASDGPMAPMVRQAKAALEAKGSTADSSAPTDTTAASTTAASATTASTSTP